MDTIRKIPLFAYHGAADNTFPIRNAISTFKYLKEEIYCGEFQNKLRLNREKDHAHCLSTAETFTLKHWLAE